MEPTLDRKGEDDDHESEGEDLDADLEANGDTGSSAGEQRLDLPPLKKMGLGENQTPTHPLGVKGAVLNLSNVGVDDETLGQVRVTPGNDTPFRSNGNGVLAQQKHMTAPRLQYHHWEHRQKPKEPSNCCWAPRKLWG